MWLWTPVSAPRLDTDLSTPVWTCAITPTCGPSQWTPSHPRRAGPATPLWFPGTHGPTHPARHRHTQTHPRPAAWLTDTGPDAPPSAATPTRPTGPGAPTATQPRGQHFCALCSQAHPPVLHTHTHTHTHTHACTYACGCAAWPFCHSSPRHHGPLSQGLEEAPWQTSPLCICLALLNPKSQGPKPLTGLCIHFLQWQQGAWNRGSFFQDSGAQMLGIKVWTGQWSQRLQGKVFPVSSSF